MHGLPGQSLEAALHDIKIAAALNCSHLSWYELTIEADTYFGSILRRFQVKMSSMQSKKKVCLT